MEEEASPWRAKIRKAAAKSEKQKLRVLGEVDGRYRSA